MLELLHLLERTALYCKCAISIHEGIYMHFQADIFYHILRTAELMAFQVIMALAKGRI